jgi:hypothetical protein
MHPDTYEWAFKEAGFTHFEWVKFGLYDYATQENIKTYQDLLDNPVDTGIVAW